MSFLLDTNVVSEIRKRSPHAAVLAWFDAALTEELFLSVLVIGEIRQGIERLRLRDPEQAARLERWLDGLRTDFAERLLPVSTAVAETWGRLNAPDPLPAIDGLLAATAIVHDLTLVTRDTSSLERLDVPYVNPWSAS